MCKEIDIIIKSIFLDKVASPRKKILSIKNFFNLKLKYIAGNGVTIACISYIISGKRNMTDYSANIISENINNALGSTITGEWLLETENSQANKLLENKFKLFQSNKDKIIEVEKVINKYLIFLDKKKVIEVCKKLIDTYYKLDINKAMKYVRIGVNSSLSINSFPEEAYFCLWKARLEILLTNADKGLATLEYTESITDDEDYIRRINYNKVICYSKLHEHEKCVNLAKKVLKDKHLTSHEITQIKMTVANSYYRIKDYDTAIELYKPLLEYATDEGDTVSMCKLNHNLADAYYEKGNIKKAEQYILTRLEIDDNTALGKHYGLAAKITNNLEFIGLAKKHLNENDNKQKINIQNIQIKICIILEYVDEFKKTLDECIEKNIKIEDRAKVMMFMYKNIDSVEIEEYLHRFSESECF